MTLILFEPSLTGGDSGESLVWTNGWTACLKLRRSLLMSLRDMGKILGVLKEEPEAFVQDHKMQVLRDLGITEESQRSATEISSPKRMRKGSFAKIWRKGILLMDRADRTSGVSHGSRFRIRSIFGC